MSPYQFLKQLNSIPEAAGEGIRVVRYLTPSALAVSGATRGPTSSTDTIIFDANDESAIVTFVVPEDFDTEAQELKVALYCRYVSGTSVVVDLDVATVNRAGAAADDITSDLTDPDGHTLDAAADNGWKEFTLSGYDFAAGDVVSVEIDAQVTGAGVAHVQAAKIQYKSGIVFQDEDAR